MSYFPSTPTKRNIKKTRKTIFVVHSSCKFFFSQSLSFTDLFLALMAMAVVNNHILISSRCTFCACASRKNYDFHGPLQPEGINKNNKKTLMKVERIGRSFSETLWRSKLSSMELSIKHSNFFIFYLAGADRLCSQH